MFNTIENRRTFVFGAITVILSSMVLLNNLLTVDYENWIALFAFALSGLVFLAIFLVDREAYAAVGVYVMLAIIGLIGMTSWFAVEGAIVPTYVLSAIALPFLVAWLFNRQSWGLLVPAYVLLSIIPIIYMGNTVAPELVPAYVLTIVGLPFFIAFLFTHKWEWLVPSGILFVLAASFLGLALGLPSSLISIGVPLIALVLGLALLLRAMAQNPDEREKSR